MLHKNPLDPLARSMYHALEAGLLPAQFTPHGWALVDGVRVPHERGPAQEHRPDVSQVEFVMFSQVWGSTSLGFGGLAGQACTAAYTVVALGPRGDACVYFNGRFAYHVLQVQGAFSEDLAKRQMANVKTAASRYV